MYFLEHDCLSPEDEHSLEIESSKWSIFEEICKASNSPGYFTSWRLSSARIQGRRALRYRKPLITKPPARPQGENFLAVFEGCRLTNGSKILIFKCPESTGIAVRNQSEYPYVVENLDGRCDITAKLWAEKNCDLLINICIFSATFFVPISLCY
jgi:hypothetical protein